MGASSATSILLRIELVDKQRRHRPPSPGSQGPPPEPWRRLPFLRLRQPPETSNPRFDCGRPLRKVGFTPRDHEARGPLRPHFATAPNLKSGAGRSSIHRKGATRALRPATSPPRPLPPRVGQPVLVPGRWALLYVSQGRRSHGGFLRAAATGPGLRWARPRPEVAREPGTW